MSAAASGMLTMEVLNMVHPLKGRKQTPEHIANRIAASPACQPVPLGIRFERMTDQSRACWLWKGKDITNSGYARMEIQGTRVSVHRAAYEHFIGPIPHRLNVLHRCDNKLCVRPDHLFLGTQADNVADAIQKDRHCAGERHGMAKLTVSDVQRIRGSHLLNRTLGLIFGVHPKHIAHIRWRRVWRHLA